MNTKDKTYQLGGKGAGLVWLTCNTELGFSVPEFHVIDTSYYEKFLGHSVSAVDSEKCPERLKAKCKELAETFKERKVAVRSSGVISENSNKFSGAGIYDTFFLKEEDVDPENLEKAILNVFKSINSDGAKRYRKEVGVTYEKMAIVVQEFVTGCNGVAMSRLPGRAKIFPVLWSNKTGAVVKGDRDALMHTMYFAQEEKGRAKGGIKTIFESDTGITPDEREFVKERIIPLIIKLRERYKKEFESEFTFDLNNKKLNMLQIRPLTNVQNIQITFPDKKPILTAELCMGVGEYIGPWASPVGNPPIKRKWKEPSHYAFIASRLEKKKQTVRLKPLAGFRNIGSLLRVGDDFTFDYDKLTPNKKAIILTHQAMPGMHAMTIANEKRILCLSRECREISEEELQKIYGTGKDMLMIMSGRKSPLDTPKFDIPFEEIGKYVHVVSDGLNGYVYTATEQEAMDFAEKNNLPTV